MQTAIRISGPANQSAAASTFDQPVDATTLYRFWGAHLVPGGVRFAVWAPNAREVSLICDNNGWTAGRTWLNSSDTGVWSAVVPGILPGSRYKYAIRTHSGQLLEKADPAGFYFERRPQTAAVVWSLRDFA
ncbi:MAG: 1,4-alpha-glucan branching enzyme GlgB, partial [Planctomycetota bacterium]